MRFEQTIRVGRLLRNVRMIDPESAPSLNSAPFDPVAERLAEMAAARQAQEEERREVQSVLTGLIHASESLVRRRNELLEEMQRAAIELAAAMTARVTYDKLESDRFALEELAKSVIGRLATGGPIEVRMHPEDIARLQRRLGDSLSTDWSDIALIADNSLGRGDCVAEAGEISFTACLEELLSGLRQHLLRNLSDAQSEHRKTSTGNHPLRRHANSGAIA